MRADRVRTEDDPRLRLRAPFALIKVDNIRFTDNETNIEDAAGLDLIKVAILEDEGYLLRPRIAKSIGGIYGFFEALRDATEDTMLELDRKAHSGPEWRVCSN